MASTEKLTQHACLQYLVSKKIFHYRNNTGAMVSEYKGRKSFMRFGTPGSPDIIMVYKGQYIGLEIKGEKGVQSESQKYFQMNLEKAGGTYYVIRSIDELIAIIRQLEQQ